MIRMYFHTGSESPIRTYDVNSDGVLDLMIGLTFDRELHTSEPEHCHNYIKRNVFLSIPLIPSKIFDTHNFTDVVEVIYDAIHL